MAINETIPVFESDEQPLLTAPATFSLYTDNYHIKLNSVIPSINTWSTQANALATEVNNNAAITAANVSATAASATEAAASAFVAQSASNYKSDWVAGYNGGAGYSFNDSVSYNGYRYVSKINNNIVEPTEQTNTAEWDFIEVANPPKPFVAKGNLPDGTPVVLNDDGTVSVIGKNSTNIKGYLENIFNAAATTDIKIAYDPNTAGKFVVAYLDGGNSNYGTAIVGTVSGNVISFGSEYVFNTAITSYISISFDPNTADKFVITYTDTGNSFYGTAIVGTISGTVITFGLEYVFNAGLTSYTSISFDPNAANKFVIAYQDAGNSSYGTAIVGTISGTVITFGLEYVFNAGLTSYTSISFDPNAADKFLVAYQDAGNSSYGTAIVGTISGTVITFGSEYVFNNADTNFISASFDPNTAGKFIVSFADSGNLDIGTAIVGTISGTIISFGSKYTYTSLGSGINSIAYDPNTADKFVIAYRDVGNSDIGKAIVGTISGTVISFGSKYTFSSNAINFPSVSFDPNTSNKFVIAYQDTTNSSYGTAIVGTISGTVITFGLEYVFNAATTNYSFISFDTNTISKFIVVYQDVGNSSYGTAQVMEYETSLSQKYIGFPTKAYSDGETASILTHNQVKDGLTGLTINSNYYIQQDGTLSTTQDTPSVLAGKAISANELVIDTKQIRANTGFKNAIVNGDFLINQFDDIDTAPVAMVNATYQIDMYTSLISGVTGTIQRLPKSLINGRYVNSIKCIATSTGSGSIGVYQKLEVFYNGETRTYGVLIKSNNANARALLYDGVSYTSSATHSGSGTYEFLSFSKDISPSATLLRAFAVISTSISGAVSITSGDYIEATMLQLEYGDFASDYEETYNHRELLKCQRYYYRFSKEVSFQDICMLAANSTTQAYSPFRFIQNMRVAPTMSFSQLSDFVIYGGGATSTPTSITAQYSSKQSIELVVVNTYTVGYVYWLRFSATGNGYIAFSAVL